MQINTTEIHLYKVNIFLTILLLSGASFLEENKKLFCFENVSNLTLWFLYNSFNKKIKIFFFIKNLMCQFL